MEDKRREDVTCSILATRDSSGKFDVELEGKFSDIVLVWLVAAVHVSRATGIPVQALAAALPEAERMVESSDSVLIDLSKTREQMEGGGGE